jgi:hypothetical protein
MWRSIFKTLLAVLLLCAMLPVAVCSARGNLVSLPNDMSITLPSNWLIHPREPDSPVLMALGRDEKGEFFGMVMVNLAQLYGQEEPLTHDKLPELSPEEKAVFLAEMEKTFLTEFNGENVPFTVKEIRDASIRNINGFHGASIAALLDSDGNEVFVEAVIIMFADRAIQLQAWCSASQYEARGREVKDIVNSFVAAKQ